MTVSYRYIDIGPDMFFTNSREEVIRLIESGKWDCTLCPQMFGHDTGYYGLFTPQNPERRTKKEAEAWLTSIEESGRRAFSNPPDFRYNLRDMKAGIPIPIQK